MGAGAGSINWYGQFNMVYADLVAQGDRIGSFPSFPSFPS